MTKFLQKSRGDTSSPDMISAAGTIRRQVRNSADEELTAVSLWAFTLGVFALLTFGLTAVPSIICGHVALSRSRNTSLGSLARSVALVGLVIGYVGAAILGTWLIVLTRYLTS